MEEQNTAVQENKRPVFLTVLCILSFIAAGFAIFGYIGVILLMGAATVALDGVSGLDGMEGFDAVASAGPSVGMTWAYIVVGFLTTIGALVGVLKMWKLKKQGFMIYTGSTVVSIIMGIVYSGFSVFGVVISAAFIVMYYLNVKHMEA